MYSSIQRFYDRVKALLSHESDLAEYFAYYLTVELAQSAATVKSVRECYEACDLLPPSWLASHFSRGLKKKPRRFIKRDGGYRLENSRREEISKSLGENISQAQTSSTLIRLETEIATGPKRDFLHETIDCFGANAHTGPQW
jgi:hypothetical protein